MDSIINLPANAVESALISQNTIIHISHMLNSSLNHTTNPFLFIFSKKFLNPPAKPHITIKAKIIIIERVNTV